MDGGTYFDLHRDYAQVLLETDGSGNTNVSYTYGDDLISQDRNSSLSYYHYDGQLSTRQFTNALAKVKDTYTCDAFGLLLNRSGSTENNYMYTGEQVDPNVGFYYLRARYYNPTIGRFHTMDTWPGMQFEPMSLHKYLYCESGPVGKWDPSGKFTLHELVFDIAFIGYLAAIARPLFGNVGLNPIEWEGSIRVATLSTSVPLLLVPRTPIDPSPPWWGGPSIGFILSEFDAEYETEENSFFHKPFTHGHARLFSFVIGLSFGLPVGYGTGDYSIVTANCWRPDPDILDGFCTYLSASTTAGGKIAGRQIGIEGVSASAFYTGLASPNIDGTKSPFSPWRGIDIGLDFMSGFTMKLAGCYKN